MTDICHQVYEVVRTHDGSTFRWQWSVWRAGNASIARGHAEDEKTARAACCADGVDMTLRDRIRNKLMWAALGVLAWSVERLHRKLCKPTAWVDLQTMRVVPEPKPRDPHSAHLEWLVELPKDGPWN